MTSDMDAIRARLQEELTHKLPNCAPADIRALLDSEAKAREEKNEAGRTAVNWHREFKKAEAEVERLRAELDELKQNPRVFLTGEQVVLAAENARLKDALAAANAGTAPLPANMETTAKCSAERAASSAGRDNEHDSAIPR